MREIRFRGKRLDNGEWVYGWYVKDWDGRSYIITKFGPYITGCSDCGAHDQDIYVVDPETVGQSTGLKDKNGHEAYEGDIFVDLTDGYCWSIAYMDGYYCAISGDETLMLHEFLENGKLDAETIGNIHDHPHLLQGEGQ